MTAVTSTDSRTGVEIIRDGFERLLNQKNADVLAQFWADDIVEELPFETLRGKAAVKRYFAETFAAIPDFHIETRSILGEGDQVFVRWHATGTFSGEPWMGIEATGTRLALDGVDHMTFKNGLLTHNFVVFDQLSFARQIGMLPKYQSAADKAMIAAFNLKTRIARGLRR